MVAARHIRLTAVLVTVVFALTGFSSTGGSSSGGSGSSGKSKSKSSGGGCSSSKSKNKKKSHNGSGNSSPTPSASRTPPPAHVIVIGCAGAGKTEATLQVSSNLDTQRSVRIPVTFQDAQGAGLDTGSVRVTLKARETRTVTVPLTKPAKASEVKTCLVGTVD
ncbi:hypothetical protein AB0892_09840 [Streptomyces sp. NPDC005409]|uniref:hypothetical protein n=1 Tax=Streptomyces sp. NPDC005409 TaxID=3155342 RepID=UPI003453725E